VRTALVVVAALAGTAAAPAAAKTGDKAWAACVWQAAPASAAAWLAMPTPDWQAPFKAPASLLGARLFALCGTPAAAELKPNRIPDFRRLASSLKAARPATPGEVDRPEARVELCRYQLPGERPFTFRYDVVRVDGTQRTITLQRYYDQVDGQPVRLPQDLRIMPKEPIAAPACAPITARGTLADA
jgi:hypothetical protein